MFVAGGTSPQGSWNDAQVRVAIVHKLEIIILLARGPSSPHRQIVPIMIDAIAGVSCGEAQLGVVRLPVSGT